MKDKTMNWEVTGLLDTIDEEKKLLTCKWLDFVSKKYIKDFDNNINKLMPEILMFPLLIHIIMVLDISALNKIDIKSLFDKINRLYFNEFSDFSKKYVVLDGDSSIDIEGDFIMHILNKILEEYES